MTGHESRRAFLKASAVAAGQVALTSAAQGRADVEPVSKDERPIRVVVWDERQPAQKEAYENFLGNAIAAHLQTIPGLSVKSVALDDHEQGLSASVLDGSAILVWWGHARHAEISPETGKRLVDRIKAGTLSLVALHSAHWSTPFMEAMNERARLDFERRRLVAKAERFEVRDIPPPRRYTLPKREDRLTPYEALRKFPDGTTKADLHLPYCCFPAYRTDGKPSQVRVLRPDHPIVAGVPREFTLARTEMYDEPFHVPEPDEVVLEERWTTGEWFRSGALWKVGAGRVFYFRPGHETFPIFKDPNVLKVLANAVRWLGARPK